MKKRCDDPKVDNYHLYGGRGITYINRWKLFKNFYSDMKDGYAEGLTLDRINNNGNYCQKNCQWSSVKAQANNRRSSRVVFYRGSQYTLSQLSDLAVVNKGTFYTRFYSGWSVEDAVNVRRYRKWGSHLH